jgi:ABC-type glycerol-3-phosphate transport system substrate-binding protein
MDNDKTQSSSSDIYTDSAFIEERDKKKIISLIIGAVVVLLIVIFAVFFVVSQLKPKTPNSVELTYWGLWEDPQVMAEVIADFNKIHPNIKVNFIQQDIKNLGKYIDRIDSQNPDLYRFHVSWLGQLDKRQMLLPLPTSVVKASEIDTKYYDVIKNDLRIRGAYFGIPIQIDTLALFVNTKIFRAAGISTYPTTWEDFVYRVDIDTDNEFKKSLASLTVKDGEVIRTSSIALGTVDNIAHATDILSLILIQNGVDLSKIEGERAASALSYYTSFAKGDSKVWDDSLDNSKLAFAKENLAMYFGYSWDIHEIKYLNPNIEFVVVPVPHIPKTDVTIASYWVEGVSSKTKHPKEAFEFLQFLTQRATLEKMFATQSRLRGFGELYPRTDMANLLQDNALLYPFVEQAKKAKSTIFSSDTQDDSDTKILNDYLADAIRSVVGDNTSPESAIETVSKGVASVIEKYDIFQK